MGRNWFWREQAGKKKYAFLAWIFAIAVLFAGSIAAVVFLQTNTNNIQKSFVSEKLPIGPGLHYSLHASRPLAISDYTGMNQPMHPKVLYFKNGWNGHRYWMSYTPYPYGDEALENPCIAVSDDGAKWRVPKGLHNPVVNAPVDAGQGAHHSDPQLVMVGDTMQLWYRLNPSDRTYPKHADNRINTIYMVSSANGVDWSVPRQIFSGSTGYISPAVLYENGTWKVWYSDYDGKLYYQQSADLVTWTNAQPVNLHVSDYDIWHQDMVHNDTGYETVFCANEKGNKAHMQLYYAQSADGIRFTAPELVLTPSNDANTVLLYRSSLVHVDGKTMVYYSARNKKGQWHIFLTDLKLS